MTAVARNASGTQLLGYQAAAPTWSDADGELGAQKPAPFIAGRSVSTGVTLRTPTRSDTVSVTTGGVKGTSPSFGVVGSLSKFVVVAPSSPPAGQPFTVKVYAEDSVGNIITPYSGTPKWSDTSKQLSGSPAAFSKGVSTTQVTLNNPYHLDQITVTKGVITGNSRTFNVVGSLSKYVVGVPASATAGQAFTVKILAEDSIGDVIPSYSGTPTWSDTSKQLSGSPAAFSNGVEHHSGHAE